MNIMRIKASKSLERLKKMKTKNRKSVVFNAKHEDEWHGCAVPIDLQAYVKIMSWCNQNVTRHYSRGKYMFWFEDEKDAFKFRLRWGSGSDS